jgi:hypothetical protein
MCGKQVSRNEQCYPAEWQKEALEVFLMGHPKMTEDELEIILITTHKEIK